MSVARNLERFDPAGTIQKALPEGWAWDERELVLLGILERQAKHVEALEDALVGVCLLYTSPSPRDKRQSRMPSSA